MRKKRNTKYSYMAGSRQHLTFALSCALACVVSLWSTRTDYCCCYYGVVAVLRLVAVLLLLLPLCTKKLKKHTRRENENTEVQEKRRKQIKAGKVQKVIDGGGVQVGTCERPGGEAIFLCRSTIVGNVSHYLTRRRFRVALL